MFRACTPPDAISLVSRLLEYTPGARLSPLQACSHSFFDELREPAARLPNGRQLPPLFNFTEYELSIQPSLNDFLKPKAEAREAAGAEAEAPAAGCAGAGAGAGAVAGAGAGAGAEARS